MPDEVRVGNMLKAADTTLCSYMGECLIKSSLTEVYIG